MSDYSTLVVAPRKSWINRGLSPLKLSTVRAGLGEPRKNYTDECQKATSELLLKHLETTAPGFRPKVRKVKDSLGKLVEEDVPVKVTGCKPALESLARILAKIREEKPEVWENLGSAGMLCCRRIRGGTDPSRHSWGLAIDLTFGGELDRVGDGLVQKGLLEVYPFFKAEGWYWGAGFEREDAMHFEAADQTVKKWMRQGLISR